MDVKSRATIRRARQRAGSSKRVGVVASQLQKQGGSLRLDIGVGDRVFDQNSSQFVVGEVQDAAELRDH